MSDRLSARAAAGFATLLLIALLMAANHVSARMAFNHGVDVPTAVTVRSLATALVVGALLLIQRVQEEPGNLPTRGMSMAQVEAKFGAPGERLEPRGGQRRDWPAINRWSYPAFTVYFERNKVIDVVMTKADPNEIGPKPPTT